MLEFSGEDTNPKTELLISNTAVTDGATLPLARLYTPPTTFGSIQVHAWGYNGSPAVTSANSQGFSAAQTGNASGATTNAGLTSWFNIVSGPGTLQNGGTLGGGGTFAEMVARLSGNGGPIGYGQSGSDIVALAGNNSPNGQGAWSIG